MRKAIGVFILLAGAGLMFSACNSSSATGSPGGGSVSTSTLVGKWLLKQEVEKGYIKILIATYSDSIAIDTTINYSDTADYIEFNTNYTYVSSYPDVTPAVGKIANTVSTTTGTWTLSGDTLTTVSSTMETLKMLVGISGSTLTATYGIDSTSADGSSNISVTITGTKQ